MHPILVNHVTQCQLSTCWQHCDNCKNVSISSHDMDTWTTLTPSCRMIDNDVIWHLWKFQGYILNNEWDMADWNLPFSYDVRLRNNLPICQDLKICFYDRENESAHFDVKRRFLSWEMTKLYSVKIWTLSVHYDIDGRRVT